MTSRQRVQALLNGKLPDRPPLYDVIRNDAIIEHFGKAGLDPETAAQTTIDAHSAALDATKGFYRLPEFEPGRTEINAEGCRVVYQRWTSWTEHEVYASASEYVEAKTKNLPERRDWNEIDETLAVSSNNKWLELERKSGDLTRDYGLAGPPRLDEMFSAVGLEAFSYYMADCPDAIRRQVEFRFEKLLRALEHVSVPQSAPVISEACDMAFKTGLIFPPSFLREVFIPGYAKISAKAHELGKKMLFHSDGNLSEILDDLVDAGIDLLHPVEPLAGMDPGEIHRRYPHLILCGTIDVSQLLPYGTPDQISDQVTRNIEETEGNIMIGSSTEINNEVPLRNYLALHETVLNYSYT